MVLKLAVMPGMGQTLTHVLDQKPFLALIRT